MSHPNARLTVRGRMLIGERARAGWAQAHIAAAMGISRRCVKRWLDRYAAEGAAGLHDRSSRPHRSPRRTSPDLEAAVVALRARERLGRDRIADRLGLSPRSVSRVLVRHGLPHLACLDPITGQLVRTSRLTTVRYERDRPGELVHMDVKKLARIPDGGGWRAHGRGSVGRGTRTSTTASWTTGSLRTTALRDPNQEDRRGLREPALRHLEAGEAEVG